MTHQRQLLGVEFYAILSVLITVIGLFGSFVFLYFEFETTFDQIGLSVCGALVGTGTSAALATFTSSNADQRILRKIDLAFDIADGRRPASMEIPAFFSAPFFLYYTSASRDTGFTWKIAKVEWKENLGNRVLKGTYTTCTPQGKPVVYAAELLGLRDKVVMLVSNPNLVESTVVDVLLNPIDEHEAFGVEQSETWLNSQKIGPVIATQTLLFGTKYPCPQVDASIQPLLSKHWEASRVEDHLRLTKHIEAQAAG